MQHTRPIPTLSASAFFFANLSASACANGASNLNDLPFHETPTSVQLISQVHTLLCHHKLTRNINIALTYPISQTQTNQRTDAPTLARASSSALIAASRSASAFAAAMRSASAFSAATLSSSALIAARRSAAAFASAFAFSAASLSSSAFVEGEECVT